MKPILLIILSCLLGQVSFAQSDSVYMAISSKLFSEIQIITPHGENGTRENFHHFKYQYWIGTVDTVSMSIVHQTVFVKSKNTITEYQQYGACDSIINTIRNSALYWQMQRDINKVVRQEIGYRNEAFNNLRNSESIDLKDFSNKCQAVFKTEISELNKQLLNEIERIKERKIDRYTKLKASPETIDTTTIISFLKTFDLCDTDLKTLELIILENPAAFVTSIDNLSDADFFSFTLKLSSFPEDAKISEMKQQLKKVGTKSQRTKKIIRKIKTIKG